jgi:hypothetical protein
MAQLIAHRSSIDETKTLFVVHLAVIYAVLTIALGFEWGRIVERMVTDVAFYDRSGASTGENPEMTLP